MGVAYSYVRSDVIQSCSRQQSASWASTCRSAGRDDAPSVSVAEIAVRF